MEDRLIVMLLIEFLILLAPLFLVFADLWSGVRKAKVRGEAITSKKYRNTVNKLAKYYNVMLALAVIDALQLSCIWYMTTYCGWGLPLFPWLTLLGSIGVGFIEVKSIMEPANKKEASELHGVSELAKAIAEHHASPEDIAKAVLSYIEGKYDKKGLDT